MFNKMIKKSVLCFASILLFIGLSGCGTNFFEGIEQKITEVEVGDMVTLYNCITKDSTKIKNVTISDRGGDDTNTVGTYTVTYSITNMNDKTKDIQYTINVVDTIAPVFENRVNEIHLVLGEEFVADKYFDVVDASNTQMIEYEGVVDVNKEGEYSIDVCAKDQVGNTSETFAVKVVVEKRECDVRNAKFGDSMETVENYEDEEPYERGTEENDRYLVCKTQLNGYDTAVVYYFNKNNQLYQVIYWFEEEHSNYNAYCNEYTDINEILKEKYGTPISEEIRKSDLYGYCSDAGEALMLGQVVFSTEWELNNMTIEHLLGNDNDVVHGISYKSKEYEKTIDISGF